ncbi:MAG: hypothetical protein PHD04_04535 [Candidatus Pacebacteria bacterium]|nr:hypothetical protein [Candidatus Paceibacterota bacterium]
MKPAPLFRASQEQKQALHLAAGKAERLAGSGHRHWPFRAKHPE